MKTWLRSGCVALLGVCAVAAAHARPAGDDTRPPRTADPLEAVIPAQLKSLLLENPSVSFLVTVSAEGKLIDHLAVEGTHHELLARAEEVLRQAVFLPGLAEGKPVQSSGRVTVYFFDPEQRAFHSGLIALPFGSTASEGASRRIYEVAKNHYVYRRAQPAELDRPVELRETKIMVLTDAGGLPAAGACVVDYYIDDHGAVRLPRVVSSDNDTVALSALLTLQHTRYAPVTRQGIPAYVKVRQPMSYAPSAEADPKPVEK